LSLVWGELKIERKSVSLYVLRVICLVQHPTQKAQKHPYLRHHGGRCRGDGRSRLLPTSDDLNSYSRAHDVDAAASGSSSCGGWGRSCLYVNRRQLILDLLVEGELLHRGPRAVLAQLRHGAGELVTAAGGRQRDVFKKANKKRQTTKQTLSE
jgi:hypothetical protein